MTAVFLSGCVALNVPSVRHHEPTDHGGLFGSWNSPMTNALGRELSHVAGQGDVVVGGSDLATGHGFGAEGYAPGTAVCFEDDWLQEGMVDSKKAATVPWPRFHPVPTRPVFGVPRAEW